MANSNFPRAKGRNEKLSVLIVDHNIPTVQHATMETSLLFLGFNVQTVQGKLSWALTQEQSFDLAFIDLNMPKNDLIATIHSIRRCREIPIIGLIIDENESDYDRSFCPADDYLVLPPRQSLFIEMLRRWLA